jgi:site-specific recombinase XerD
MGEPAVFIRSAEVHDQMDVEHRILTVRQGKGKKDRQIPLVDDPVKALRNYMRYRNTQLIVDDEIFFGFDHGAGHPFLFLDDAKAPNCRKNNIAAAALGIG